MKKRVSIITVVYNGIDTLQRTIDSVVSQKYDEIEYIVIDGGSTDGTIALLQKNNANISRWVSEADEGIYDAMNKAIRMATGDVIGIINSDDWYEPDAVQIVVNAFERTDADIVYGNLNLVTDNQVKLQKHRPLSYIRWMMAIPHPTVFVKRSVYERIGLFDCGFKIAADYDLMNRAYSQQLKFAYIDRILANFSEGGVSETNFKQCDLESRAILDKYFEFEMFRQALQSMTDDNMKRFAIFGAGRWGERMAHVLNELDLKVDFFVDNSRSKWGREMNGITIVPPSQLLNYQGCTLILSEDYENEIYQQLCEMGLSDKIERFSGLMQIYGELCDANKRDCASL